MTLVLESIKPQIKKAKMMSSVATTTTALRVKRITELATLPTRGSAQAAGYDLYSAYDVSIPAKGKAIVKTDISIALPDGTYGKCFIELLNKSLLLASSRMQVIRMRFYS